MFQLYSSQIKAAGTRPVRSSSNSAPTAPAEPVVGPLQTRARSLPPPDDYTDYACSTPLERLARDLETVLRSWHLNHNDRHVSFFDHERSSAAAAASSSSVRRSSTSRRRINFADDGKGTVIPPSTPSPTAAAAAAASSPGRRVKKKSSVLRRRDGASSFVGGGGRVVNGVRAVRTSDLTTDGGEPLRLTLWDGPPPAPEDAANARLPLSLRGRSVDTTTTDLSALFGIGQHLVLCSRRAPPEKERRSDGGRASVDHLQTALNVAVHACDCRVPAFALPHEYDPPRQSGRRRNLLAVPPLVETPPWLARRPTHRGGRRREGFLGTILSRSTDAAAADADAIKYHPPVLRGRCHPGPSPSAYGAAFVVEHVPDCVPHHLDSVDRLALLLHRAVVSEHAGRDVALSDVRTVRAAFSYEWDKARTVARQASLSRVDDQVDYYNNLEWRAVGTKNNAPRSFRRKAVDHALTLLRDAHAEREPLWGPLLDPLSSVRVLVKWSADALKGCETLDPTARPPSSFTARVHWDRSVPCNSASASVRCVLAALVRSSALHKDTLLCQLSNPAVLAELRRRNTELNEVAAETASVLGRVTKGLVEAMGASFVEDIALPDREDIARRIDAVMDARLFPTPDADVPRAAEPTRAAAPPGRLLSVLASQIGQMRTPARMAALWTAFVERLRVQWEMRETLPNLNKIRGLDHTEVKILDDEYTVGKKANLAAFNNCSEPDPDHNFCLIGQKLQVFNIGVECAIATENSFEDSSSSPDAELSSRPFDYDDQDGPPSAYPASTISNTDSDAAQHQDALKDDEFYDSAPTKPREEESVHVTQRTKRLGARCPVMHSNLVASGDQLFAPYLQRPLPVTEDVKIRRKIMMSNQESSIQSRIDVAQRLRKPKLLSDMRAFKAANPGAVFQDFVNWYGNPGSPFEGLGYDENLNDDSDDEATCFTARTSRSRSSFATARTGATFATAKSYRTATSFKSARTALTVGDVVGAGSSADAVSILTSTRTFWSETWDEADATPAAAQRDRLFDPDQEVEMVLHLFDTLHPAHLLNQMLAVNLSTAAFVLRETAGEATLVRTVRTALDRLSERVDDALDALEEDLFSSMFEDGDHVSQDACARCDAACDAVGDVEVLLSRAASLLHKFPGEYDLVQRLLRKRDGEEVDVTNRAGRVGILRTVWRHRDFHRSAEEKRVWDDEEKDDEDDKNRNHFWPPADVREYVLRSTASNQLPYQLTAVLQNHGRDDISKPPNEDPASRKNGSVLLALTKCQQE